MTCLSDLQPQKVALKICNVQNAEVEVGSLTATILVSNLDACAYCFSWFSCVTKAVSHSVGPRQQFLPPLPPHPRSPSPSPPSLSLPFQITTRWTAWIMEEKETSVLTAYCIVFPSSSLWHCDCTILQAEMLQVVPFFMLGLWNLCLWKQPRRGAERGYGLRINVIDVRYMIWDNVGNLFFPLSVSVHAWYTVSPDVFFTKLHRKRE